MLSVKTRLPLEAIFRVFIVPYNSTRFLRESSDRDSQLANQIAIMNQVYYPTVTFVQVGVRRTVNPDWFNNAGPESPQQTAMKDALHTGGPGDLNVYTVGYCI